MTYGERIRQGRESKRLTQEQLAEALEVSRQAVSKWEMDLSRPARAKLVTLSEVLEIPLETWAAIDKEAEAVSRPKGTARPWRITVCVLTVFCLLLGSALAAALWYYNRPASGASAPAEPAADPAVLEEVFPDMLPLKGRRDFDFGNQPLGEYDPVCVSFLDDYEKMEEQEVWSGLLRSGEGSPAWLRVVKTDPRYENGATFYNLYMLYAVDGGGALEWNILMRFAEENCYLDTFSAEEFTNVLGYDGWKISITVGASAGALNFYFTLRPDGMPALIAVGNNAREADVDEDGEKEIISLDEVPLFCEIMDTERGQEGAFVYTLDPYSDGFANVALSFAPEKGGFVVTDSHDAVLARYVLRDSVMVRVPITDFTAMGYPDVAGTRIEFVTADVDGLSDGLDPDNVLYNGKARITHRQQAYLALQELYDLTGIKLDFCYCAANEYGVFFSLLPDGFNQRSFFTADFTEDFGGNGSIPQFHIAWRELGNDWSPLSLAEAVLPGPEVPPETVLGWYYGRLNLFRTGEAALETAGEFSEERNLYLENGDLYVGTLRDADLGPALVCLCGPYPGGAVNH